MNQHFLPRKVMMRGAANISLKMGIQSRLEHFSHKMRGGTRTKTYLKNRRERKNPKVALESLK
jgi:hypothetical protein